MKSNGFVFALQVHTSVQEEDGVSEGCVVLFVEDVDQISQEKAIPDLDKPALIVDDFVDVVSKHALDSPEDVGVCLF